MLKIMKDLWGKNQDKLREALLLEQENLKTCSYMDLVRITFENVWNSDGKAPCQLDLRKIHEIDDGDYQGTLVYMIPFQTYQPEPYEYLLTCVRYGSCSGCDALQAEQACWSRGDISGFMSICKDVACNTVKPYNSGWMHDDRYDDVEEKGP